MALPPAIVSKAPSEVLEHVVRALDALGGAGSRAIVARVVHDMEDAFAGRRAGYLANDMRYHDLGHSLQATVCMADLIQGQQRTEPMPGFGRREAELGVMATLLHDVGFLKHTGDNFGTGAKYTLTHERRSCDFARTYLSGLGAAAGEVDDVCAAISCTGPRNRISTHSFRSPVARRLACLLVTADYVAQMSAPDYPDKLDFLFAEFVEAYDYENVPAELRPYRDANELRRKTPDFWEKFVRPMLDSEADGVHRFLSATGQANSYLEAIARNVATIRRRAESGAANS